MAYFLSRSSERWLKIPLRDLPNVKRSPPSCCESPVVVFWSRSWVAVAVAATTAATPAATAAAAADDAAAAASLTRA